MKGQQEKQLKLQQGWVCYTDFILLEDCPPTGFCCDLEPSFFFWYREGDTIPNGDFPYKCNFYSVFRYSFVSTAFQK